MQSKASLGSSREVAQDCGVSFTNCLHLILLIIDQNFCTTCTTQNQTRPMHLLRNFPAAFAGRGRRGFHGQVHARAKHQLYVRAVRLHGSIHQLQLAEHPSAAASGTTCERKEGEATACSPIGNPSLTDATAANFFHWSFHSLSAPLWTQTNNVAASGTRSQEPCLTYI